MTRISLVRHGQTDWNLAKRIQGSSDIPLNATGRDQAEATGRALAGGRYDAIYASPLSRATETAQIIAVHTGLSDPVPLDALAERRYGEAEGLTGAEILARWPDGDPRSRAGVAGRGRATARFPRCSSSASGIADESVIVVSHGGVIGSLVRHVTAHALPGPGEVIPNGSVHEFVYDDGTSGTRPLQPAAGGPRPLHRLGALTALRGRRVLSDRGGPCATRPRVSAQHRQQPLRPTRPRCSRAASGPRRRRPGAQTSGCSSSRMRAASCVRRIRVEVQCRLAADLAEDRDVADDDRGAERHRLHERDAESFVARRGHQRGGRGEGLRVVLIARSVVEDDARRGRDGTQPLPLASVILLIRCSS